MKIGVTGATGQLGHLVVESLKKKVDPSVVVGLVRTPAKASDLGVEVRAFDYSQPGQMEKSLEGIDRLLLISSSEVGKRAVQHQNVINAAKAAGVKWIVYTSLLHADASPLSLADEHITTEQALKTSGIPYTILRNGWYTENYVGSVKKSVAAGAIIGSAGSGKIASAPRIDYAEAAATVVADDKHVGKLYELAGDNAYTLTDLAKEVSRQTGKDIPYNNLPEEKYAEILVGLGLPEGLAATIAGWDVGVSNNALFDDGKQLSKLIGRPTTALADVVKKALA